mmetsp:Transcript_48005/g.93765  ORF Transcript_48005/g.93765 Transcript_48005/m.93765 type:complete len:280 (-) Transcript_48005:941-1780(-)
MSPSLKGAAPSSSFDDGEIPFSSSAPTPLLLSSSRPFLPLLRRRLLAPVAPSSGGDGVSVSNSRSSDTPFLGPSSSCPFLPLRRRRLFAPSSKEDDAASSGFIFLGLPAFLFFGVCVSDRSEESSSSGSSILSCFLFNRLSMPQPSSLISGSFIFLIPSFSFSSLSNILRTSFNIVSESRAWSSTLSSSSFRNMSSTPLGQDSHFLRCGTNVCSLYLRSSLTGFTEKKTFRFFGSPQQCTQAMPYDPTGRCRRNPHCSTADRKQRDMLFARRDRGPLWA